MKKRSQIMVSIRSLACNSQKDIYLTGRKQRQVAERSVAAKFTSELVVSGGGVINELDFGGVGGRMEGGERRGGAKGEGKGRGMVAGESKSRGRAEGRGTEWRRRKRKRAAEQLRRRSHCRFPWLRPPPRRHRPLSSSFC